MKKVMFNGFRCVVVPTAYAVGMGLALRLKLAEDDPQVLAGEGFPGEPIATATVNLPKLALAADEVAIKDYSENEGMLQALMEAGVVSEPLRYVRSGFESLPICRVNREVAYAA